MGNPYKALLSQKSRKFDAEIQLIVPKSTCVHKMWDWSYLGRAMHGLREEGQSVDENLLAHLSSLGWEHINLTGDYVWHSNKRVAKGRFRPLRSPRDSMTRLFTPQPGA
jgi:hypothetical protein